MRWTCSKRRTSSALVTWPPSSTPPTRTKCQRCIFVCQNVCIPRTFVFPTYVLLRKLEYATSATPVCVNLNQWLKLYSSAAPLLRRQSLRRNDLHCGWRWQARSLGLGGPQAEGAQDLGIARFLARLQISLLIPWFSTWFWYSFLQFPTVSYVFLLHYFLPSSDLKRAFNVTT